ncbi:secreted frizzled-related protein 3-like [Ranitomeya variabilis]|uniref:secreted frizzled-related protein 3-like n=1 Tax=Ranitomeya variabilis TaxID=490064 RepID=UPI0040564D12
MRAHEHSSALRTRATMETIQEHCRCKPMKASQKTYLKNNYNYVIRAKVKEVKVKCHDATAVVEVKEILKSSLVNIPKDTVTLYTNSGCLCPQLVVNEEYIIMGYEDKERTRLLLVEGSLAEKWRDRLAKKVKRWDQKLRCPRKIKSVAQNANKNSNSRQMHS